ncbi:hypothetical protein EAG_09257 [Camponotus floridanus]|uniref:Uncharacterized protein n=1 Tax=Camponotus floridanus TaxID=104421 RepID=E2A293_CAMFO|nr:hypothetical protein EAG_09257 [Camponotus floridanus]
MCAKIMWAKELWAKELCAKELCAKELCAKELCAKELCPIERTVILITHVKVKLIGVPSRKSRSNIKRWWNRQNQQLKEGLTEFITESISGSPLNHSSSLSTNTPKSNNTHSLNKSPSILAPSYSSISSPAPFSFFPDTLGSSSPPFSASPQRSPTPILREPSPSPPPSPLIESRSPSPSPVITLDSDPPSPFTPSESSEFFEDPEDFARYPPDLDETSHPLDFPPDSPSEHPPPNPTPESSHCGRLNYFISQFPLLDFPIPEGSFCVGPGDVNHEEFLHYLTTAPPDSIIPWYLPGPHLPLAVPIQALLRKFPPSIIQFDDP